MPVKTKGDVVGQLHSGNFPLQVTRVEYHDFGPVHGGIVDERQQVAVIF